MQHKICGSETQMGANNSSKWWLACKKVAKSLNSLFRVLSSTVYMWAQHYNPTQIWLFYREFWLLLFHSSPQPSFAIHNYLCLEPVILQAKKFVQKKSFVLSGNVPRLPPCTQSSLGPQYLFTVTRKPQIFECMAVHTNGQSSTQFLICFVA